MSLGEECGLRPLVAQVHLSLGKLLRQADDRARAADHLRRALTSLRSMDMRFWLEQASDEIAALGRFFVVARDQGDLHAYMQERFARDERIQVVMDRRRTERRQRDAGPPDQKERRTERRRRLAIEEELVSHGLVIVPEPEPAGA
jgi:hypothetical protein